MNSFICTTILATILFDLASASNVVISGNNVAIVASSLNQFGTQQLPNGSFNMVALPNGISSFSDVAFDPTNEQIVFALSTDDSQVCSFLLDGTALNFVNCVGGNFAVSPFCGVSAHGGTVVVSGGVGGLTAYEYDMQSGEISALPRFLNVELANVVGHPDVLLIDGNLAALSTDFSGSPQFGTMMVDASGSSPVRERDFRVSNSLGFDLALGPANFPLVNAYNEEAATMYTANGALTAQDPRVDDTTVDMTSAISTRAITCAVDSTASLLVVGGEQSNGNFLVEVFDIDEPNSPQLLQQMAVTGRLTSVATKNGLVVYSTQNGSIESFSVQQIATPTATPTASLQPASSPMPTAATSSTRAVFVTTYGLVLAIIASVVVT